MVPPGSGAEQIIAFNDGDGVFIEDGTANKVWSNSIHSNSGLGIDLLPDGVTFNDSDDGDIGANDLQNFPVVTSVKTNEDPAQTVIKGRLTSAAGTSYRIEFFANTECDPSGFGEGERFLGSDTAASDTDGNAAFQLTVSEVVSNITLTATNLDTGDTSEFSRCGAPIQVNSVGDDGDADLSDGACDTGATVSRDGASEPECTLRAAIQTANNNAGPDVIAFDIPSKGPHDIQLTGGLSDLADPVTIDGTTEPDFTNVPVVKIDGSAAGPDVDGLRMTGGNSTVRGVIIARFKGNGIEITSSGNTVEGSFIGPGPNDTPLAANGGHGVYISSGASNNTISGSFISGNEGDGVRIERPDTTGNTVQGSFIGTDMDGSAAVPNQGDGVHIGDGATNNTVGGDTVSAGNVISGNMGDGVEIEGSGTTGNKLKNNLIGTNASGNDKLADSKSNAGHGVFINDAPNNTVGGSGNVISGNGMNGELVSGQTATGNSVKGNQIGTDKDDINELGNAQNGVEIRGAPGNTVGGTVVDEGNIISANRLAGVLITGAGATGNLVHGNIIGTDNIGVVDLGNGGSGVQITGSADNTIGGTDEGAGNVISGNVKHGVEIAGDRNRVQDNFIGTTRDGTGPMPNDMNGVVVEGSDNLIDEGNLISGNLLGGVVIKGSDSSRNKVEGNHIGTDVSGGQGLGNGQDGVRIAEGASDNVVGGTTLAARNLISGNGQSGVAVDGIGPTGAAVLTSGNVVQGNYIGTTKNGGAKLGNVRGVEINDAINTLVGGAVATQPAGPCSGACNLISGNVGDGVIVRREGSLGTPGTVVQGNFIGTDAAGAADLGNGQSGVKILNNVSGVLIGGATAAARNLISGNDNAGVEIDGGTLLAPSGITVQGNYVGTNAGGGQRIGNLKAGVLIDNGFNNLIGGTDGTVPEEGCKGACNLISGNLENGITIKGPVARGNRVQGNYIGTDVSGVAGLGNGFDGIKIAESASENIIGEPATAARNLISANAGSGLVIEGTDDAGIAPTSDNVIQGNYIGTNRAGSAQLGNTERGVLVLFNVSGVAIGGVNAAEGNVIAGNGDAGVDVFAGTQTAPTGVKVLGSPIYSNAGLGIDLNGDGVSLNDPGDGDNGPNGLQNFPALTVALIGSTEVRGTLDSSPNTTFRIEIFASGACDASGYGEGGLFLGATTATTDGAGRAKLEVTFASQVPPGSSITATATGPSGNTSEFSQCVGLEVKTPPDLPGVTFPALIGMAMIMTAALVWRMRRRTWPASALVS